MWCGVSHGPRLVTRAAQLNGFEVVQHVHVETQAFTLDKGLLTPTLKLRRSALLAHYRQVIRAMYDHLRRH